MKICKVGHERSDQDKRCKECARIYSIKYKQSRGSTSKKEFLELRSKLQKLPFNEIFEYSENSPSGLIWLIDISQLKLKGKPAGTIGARGYSRVEINNKAHACYRIVWELHYGPVPEGVGIDHIDKNPSNNKIENLRLCTRAQNMHNRGMFKNNTTGVKCLFKEGTRWRGIVQLNGVRYSKRSVDREFLEKWIKDKRESLHKEFASHG